MLEQRVAELERALASVGVPQRRYTVTKDVDALAGLQSLGYGQREARALLAAVEEDEGASTEERLVAALRVAGARE